MEGDMLEQSHVVWLRPQVGVLGARCVRMVNKGRRAGRLPEISASPQQFRAPPLVCRVDQYGPSNEME